MTGGSARQGTSAPDGHVPVLLDPVLKALSITPDARIVDGTFGAGGYSAAILAAGGIVVAIDRDPDAVARGGAFAENWPDRFTIVEGRFADLDVLANAAGFGSEGVPGADGVVLDVGVSSMQLDTPTRGFSFRLDGPLDMRMSVAGASAADVVNRAPVRDLAMIIGRLGEEKKAGRIARAIDKARQEEPFTGTSQLANVVAAAAGPKGPQRIHPATRTFQGLRIFVNRELEQLALALAAAERLLVSGGRLVVVAFHSLEDRIVKRFLQTRSRTAAGSRHGPPIPGEEPTFSLTRGQPIAADDDEIDANPRARSARMRFGTRTDAPERPIDLVALGANPIAGLAGPEAYA